MVQSHRRTVAVLIGTASTCLLLCVPAPAHAAPDDKPAYECETALVSLAASLGGYITIGPDLGTGAFMLDVDAGARPMFMRSSRKGPRWFRTLVLWPIVGYSFAKLNPTPMHLITTGVGVGFGPKSIGGPKLYFIPRFIAGTANNKWGVGARFDVQVALGEIWGLSAGYQALFTEQAHHGVRLMVMIDLGSVVSQALILRGLPSR